DARSALASAIETNLAWSSLFGNKMPILSRAVPHFEGVKEARLGDARGSIRRTAGAAPEPSSGSKGVTALNQESDQGKRCGFQRRYEGAREQPRRLSAP